MRQYGLWHCLSISLIFNSIFSSELKRPPFSFLCSIIETKNITAQATFAYWGLQKVSHLIFESDEDMFKEMIKYSISCIANNQSFIGYGPWQLSKSVAYPWLLESAWTAVSDGPEYVPRSLFAQWFSRTIGPHLLSSIIVICLYCMGMKENSFAASCAHPMIIKIVARRFSLQCARALYDYFFAHKKEDLEYL